MQNIVMKTIAGKHFAFFSVGICVKTRWVSQNVGFSINIWFYLENSS
jgi:hypothetical protein